MARKLVTIIFSPVTERYWTKGDTATLDGDKIRLGGAWFDFDDRWEIQDK